MVKFALVRLLNPAHLAPSSTRADVWRDVVAVRLATVIALALALAALQLARPVVAWGALLGAALLIPVLSSKRPLRRTQCAEPWMTCWRAWTPSSGNPRAGRLMRRRSMGRSSGCSAGRSSDTCSPARGRRTIHPDDMGVVEHASQAAAGDGHTIRYRIRTLSGTYRWIEDIVNVVKNDRGEVTHTRGVCRDVSEAVAASRFAEQYVQFIDSLPLGVMILPVVPGDSTSFVVRAENPSVEPFGPSSMASPIGQRLIDARPGAFHGRRGDDDAGLVEVVADAVQDQRPAFIESLDLKLSATGSNCTYRSGSHR